MNGYTGYHLGMKRARIQGIWRIAVWIKAFVLAAYLAWSCN